MPSRSSSSGRPSLSHQLDREIYQVVQKLAEDEEDMPGISEVYQKIKNSNSSLNRRPKKVLESSIERVINVIEADQLGDDSDTIDDEPVPEEKDLVPSNALNRSITGLWTKSGSSYAINGTQVLTDSVHDLKERPLLPPLMETKSRKRPAKEMYPRKRTRPISNVPPSNVDLEDLGGVGPVVKQLSELLLIPLLSPVSYSVSGIEPPRGIILHGPPGCGKTMMANAFAALLEVPFIQFSAPSVVSGMSGESEKALREYFDEAKKVAPCLMFIDEIDAITSKRENAQREMEKRIVAQLLTCMDDLALENTGGRAVIVIAATNRLDSLDPALRRGGRFDKEIAMNIPTQSMREKILRVLTRKLQLADGIDFAKLALRTPGFVGADLKDLVSTVGSIAIARAHRTLMNVADPGEMDLDNASLEPELREVKRAATRLKVLNTNGLDIKVTNQDFFDALPFIQPSLKREGFTTLPDTTWADVGALSDIQQQLKDAIVYPILHPEKYAKVGITTPSGVLLCGPPGCGKTLLAKATANEAQANFITIRGPQLLNKYVGESERAVREVFTRARSSAPCVVFFDEFDSLATKRNDEAGSNARVVNALLAELDGADDRNGVFVVATTNRVDMIDEALLRPGRFEKILRVGLPQKEDRVTILKTLLRRIDITFDDAIKKIAEDCEGFSGADLAGLVRQAGFFAVARDDGITLEDLVKAQKTIQPSVGDDY
ncbi:MAG: hypothetical protein GOMPHAMPRED_007265 [Gomphillus americanus]|uniref:Peroxisomal ATPase PEX1 n=1 Tax=Gomphillus americanus TaxID=1940652 RepID=A0A8H3EVE3_9LECA|nr:MAG: hypothetical protein GOMPHAMPRED_007265 [Gomphillus americanus]